MKKIFALLLAVVMLMTIGMVGCSTQTPEADDTLTVGFDAEFEPYGYKDPDTGEYTGFDLELAEEVCDRLGWELVKQPIDWASKDMELNSGTIDCIWNGFTINGREEQYVWSKPYIDNQQVILVKADSDIKELADLADKNVVVQSDSSALKALEGEKATAENKALAKTFKELRQVADYNTALMELESGVCDAVGLDVAVADIHMKNNPDKYVMLEEILATEQYGIGFKLGNEALRDTVEEKLDEMMNDGTFMEIAEKYKLAGAVCYGEE